MKRWHLALIAGLFVVIIGVAWFVSSRNTKLTLTITVTPLGSKVAINGSNYSADQGSVSVQLKPGPYQVTASHDDYQSETKSIVLAKNSNTLNFDLVSSVDQALGNGLPSDYKFSNVPSPESVQITDKQFFDNNTWAIVTLSVLNEGAAGFAILHQTANGWVTVAGPGTSFRSTIKPSLPADVYSRLVSMGVVAQ